MRQAAPALHWLSGDHQLSLRLAGVPGSTKPMLAFIRSFPECEFASAPTSDIAGRGHKTSLTPVDERNRPAWVPVFTGLWPTDIITPQGKCWNWQTGVT